MTRARAEEYRRRAQECLDIARTLPPGPTRAILIDVSQTWLRLAEEQDAAVPPDAVEQAQPVAQQQQQIQAEDGDKKDE